MIATDFLEYRDSTSDDISAVWTNVNKKQSVLSRRVDGVLGLTNFSSWCINE